jgi:hypothetical protein
MLQPALTLLFILYEVLSSTSEQVREERLAKEGFV